MIDSDNGLSPVRHQADIYTDAVSNRPLDIKKNETLIKFNYFHNQYEL